jgi:hypothetical protein
VAPVDEDPDDADARFAFARLYDGTEADVMFYQSAFTDRAAFDRFWAGVDLAEFLYLRSGFRPRRTRCTSTGR